jgi:hypothetical protein
VTLLDAAPRESRNPQPLPLTSACSRSVIEHPAVSCPGEHRKPRISIQTQNLLLFSWPVERSYVSNWAVSHSIPINPKRRPAVLIAPVTREGSAFARTCKSQNQQASYLRATQLCGAPTGVGRGHPIPVFRSDNP